MGRKKFVQDQANWYIAKTRAEIQNSGPRNLLYKVTYFE